MQRATSPRRLLGLAALCALASAAVAASGADRAVFLAMNAAAARWLPEALPSCLTLLGNGLVAVMVLAPLLERSPKVLAAALYAAPLAGILSWAGKRIAAVPRPAAVLDPALLHVQGPLLRGHNSFPSGHSITAFLVVTVVLLGADPLGGRRRYTIALLGLAFLVGASRVLVGAHWPSDVLGGAALGTLSGVLGARLAQLYPFWRRKHATVAMALVVLACAAALAMTDTGYPLALALQWATTVLGSTCAGLALLHAARAQRGAPRP